MCQKVENVFKLTFRFHAYLGIPEILESHGHKKTISDTNAKLKCRKLFYYSQTVELK